MAVDEPPVSPYRAERPLQDLIPPDRRRRVAVFLVIASALAGMAGLRLTDDLRSLWRETHPPQAQSARPPTPARTSHVGPMVLRGPNQRAIAIPQSTAVVVNVWLQGCADCIPAFEAYQAIAASGGLGVGVPVINVAYGQADVAWASRYHVEENLVFDSGDALVKPLGIGSFTTLVIDAQGDVVLVDRPDHVGYAGRVGDTLRRLGYAVPLPAGPVRRTATRGN